MNVVRLNECLSGDYDAICLLLERLGLSNITYNSRKNEIRCSRESGRNPTSVCINVETLYYTCFSTNAKGSIYSLVMERLNLNFPQALEWIVNELGLDKRKLNIEIKLPFSGYYKQITKYVDSVDPNIQIYDKSILEKFSNKCNHMFLKDNISCASQYKFSVGYDPDTARITIPQWTTKGELMGVMGRLNSSTCDIADRWLPIISSPRSLTVYGYHFNYAAIQNSNTCLILESEKSVMQMDTMGYHWGLALGTNSLSEIQIKYIKALRVNNIIIGYDEGVDEEKIRLDAKKLKVQNTILSNNVGYIMDGDHEILAEGSKASPTDLGKEALKQLIRSKVKWI